MAITLLNIANTTNTAFIICLIKGLKNFGHFKWRNCVGFSAFKKDYFEEFFFNKWSLLTELKFCAQKSEA